MRRYHVQTTRFAPDLTSERLAKANPVNRSFAEVSLRRRFSGLRPGLSQEVVGAREFLGLQEIDRIAKRTAGAAFRARLPQTGGCSRTFGCTVFSIPFSGTGVRVWRLYCCRARSGWHAPCRSKARLAWKDRDLSVFAVHPNGFNRRGNHDDFTSFRLYRSCWAVCVPLLPGRRANANVISPRLPEQYQQVFVRYH